MAPLGVSIQLTGFMISPLSKLGLGSAQFGLDSTTLVRGRSPVAEAREILDIAARSCLPVLDVDGHSGVAEATLGEIMPRPNPFRVSVSTVRPDRGPDHVEAEARATLRRLGVEQADAILVPAAADLFGPHGLALWDRLKALKDQGLTRKIGVSVFASDDPLGVARRFRPDIVQAPASLLDQRLLINGTLQPHFARAPADRRGSVRSVAGRPGLCSFPCRGRDRPGRRHLARRAFGRDRCGLQPAARS